MNEQTPFTQVYNDLINDESVSFKAKGLFAYIQSKPREWKYYFNDLVNHSKDGKDSIRSGLCELEDAGYLKRVAVRDDKGHTSHSVYHLSFSKEFSKEETPRAENPKAENPPLSNTNLKVILTRSNTNSKEKNKDIVQSEIDTVSPSDKKRKRFDKFWEFYGLKKNKALAIKMWMKMSEAQIDEMSSKVKAYLESEEGQRCQMHPSTYLNPTNKRWNDEISDPNARTPLSSVAKVSKNTGAFARS